MAKKTTKKTTKVRSRDLTRGLYPLVFEALHEHLPSDQAAARTRRVIADFKAKTED